MIGEESPFNKEGIKRQKLWSEQFEKTIEKFNKEADNLLLIGDYNVDQLPENLPITVQSWEPSSQF